MCTLRPEPCQRRQINYGSRALTAGCIESAAASLALEVFCFLVIDQDLEIVKVALAVVAPRPRENLRQVGVITLLLRHSAKVLDCGGKGWKSKIRTV